MVNSSLKNSLARRNHKERSQPLHRQRLGLLEKHKDYVHRARDYKSKQERIRKLREKAAFKNKDEFYWGMVKGKTQNGVAIGDRGNEALAVDVVKLLKTQDVGYVKVQIAKDEKKIARLRAELEVTAPAAGPSSEWSAASELAEVERMAEMGIVLKPSEEGRRRKGKGKAREMPAGHVVFVDDREEFETFGSSRPSPSNIVAGAEAEEEVDLGWATPVSRRKKREQPPPTADEVDEGDLEEEARQYRLDLLSDLSAHLGRLKLLRLAEAKLATTKGLMGKGAAKKVRDAQWVEDDNAPEDRNGERKRKEEKMWKWKMERKR